MCACVHVCVCACARLCSRLAAVDRSDEYHSRREGRREAHELPRGAQQAPTRRVSKGAKRRGVSNGRGRNAV
eukprot:73556-Prymnesium_polylepis.2